LVVQKGNGLTVSQYTQLSMGTKPVAHSLTVFKQGTGSIVTEQISDRKDDLVQYRNIGMAKNPSTGNPLDASGVVGKWARLTANDPIGSATTTGLFDQALMGIVPVANLQPDVRNKLVAYMQDNGVFTFDASKVKTTTEHGRRTYLYTVSIQPAGYVALMQQFGKLVGATQYEGLEPNSYVGAAAETATFSVDVLSHQLTQINQASSGHTEQYAGFGIVANLPLPKATLTTTQLEQRITNLR